MPTRYSTLQHPATPRNTLQHPATPCNTLQQNNAPPKHRHHLTRVWIWECDTTHSDVWHDPFRCVTRLIQMCDMTPQYRKWSRNLIPRRLRHWMRGCEWECDMTHSDVWHDSPISGVWHDPFKCVTWLIQMCDMTPHIESDLEIWSRDVFVTEWETVVKIIGLFCRILSL